MGSIVGENKKWKNAASDDIASIDALISAKTTELNSATQLLSEALNAISLCNDKASPNGIFKPGCLQISGRHITSWREQRDINAPLVSRYKAELVNLQGQRASLVTALNASTVLSQNISTASVATAAADEAIAQSEVVQATATASKIGIYLLIGGIGLVVVIGGIFAFKMLKKKQS
jgi:hypothetical protein